tara:strand:- start:14486 stop:14785 length:300 start_codon:yes stop_codon:yes gene_type:complete
MQLITKVLAELFGSFIFFTCVMMSSDISNHTVSAIVSVVGLLTAIVAFGKISGGHFNSSISIMKYLNGDINMLTLFSYIFAQIIGAILALIWWKFSNKN